MDILKNVNIIGNETHGDRYRDSALFYPTVQNLAYNDTDFSKYDTIILAEPYLWNEEFENNLVKQKFTGLLIMEKMPFSSSEALEKFMSEEYSFSVRHAMLRLFEDSVVNADEKNFTIRWPNLISNNMSKVRHTLPNAIIFCFAQFGMNVGSISKIDLTSHTLDAKFANEKHVINLKIYDTDDLDACISVNGVNLRWPSYMQLIHRFFDSLVNENDERKFDGNIIADIVKVIEQIEK